VNYLPEDSFVFFLLAEQSGATCLSKSSLFCSKKNTRECGYTRVWDREKQQELEKKKREDGIKRTRLRVVHDRLRKSALNVSASEGVRVHECVCVFLSFALRVLCVLSARGSVENAFLRLCVCVCLSLSLSLCVSFLPCLFVCLEQKFKSSRPCLRASSLSRFAPRTLVGSFCTRV